MSPKKVFFLAQAHIFLSCHPRGKTCQIRMQGEVYTKQSPSHTKGLGGGWWTREAKKTPDPEGLNLSGYCPPVLGKRTEGSCLENAIPGSLLEQKRELQPHKLSHPPVPSSTGHLSLPSCCPTPLSKLFWDSSSQHHPAREHHSPSSPILPITHPSLHRLQTWQLPVSMHPHLSLAPSLKSRANNLSVPN